MDFYSVGVGGESRVMSLHAPGATGSAAGSSPMNPAAPTVTWWPGTAAQNAFREAQEGATVDVPTRSVDDIVPQSR